MFATPLSLSNMFSLSPCLAVAQVNPGQYGLVAVSSSEGRNLPYGHLEDVLSRESAALNCHTNDDKNAWFAIDLGVWILPSSYTLRWVGRHSSLTFFWHLFICKPKIWLNSSIHSFIHYHKACSGLRSICASELVIPSFERWLELDHLVQSLGEIWRGKQQTTTKQKQKQ